MINLLQTACGLKRGENTMCTSILLVRAKPGLEEDVEKNLLFHEGVVKWIKNGPKANEFYVEVETDDTQKLGLFVEEQLFPLDSVEVTKLLFVTA